MPQALTIPSASNTMTAGLLFPATCTLIVFARFRAKKYLQSSILLDDWLTLPALISTSGMGIALVIGVVNKGLGHPTPQPPDPIDRLTFLAPQTVTTRKVEFAIELLQFPALTCTKLSLLLFYRRVFCTPWREVLRMMFALLITLCALWGVGFFFSMTFICGTHFPAFWTTVKELRAHCPHLHTQQAWMACSDFVIDAIIFVIPIPLILRMHMTIKRKLAVMTVFLFASVTVAASITRMIIFLRAIQDLKKRYASSGYDNLIITAGLYWTMVETGLGLIAICLPSLYALVRAAWMSHWEQNVAQSNSNARLVAPEESSAPFPSPKSVSRDTMNGSTVRDLEKIVEDEVKSKL